MRILVTGAGGQLASAIKLMLSVEQRKTTECVFASKKELDIRDAITVSSALKSSNFDYVINTAAYTKVDQAEKDRDQCHAINVLGVKNLIQACNEFDARLIHISTDYVFSGRSHRPYTESDAPSPISYYGQSKFAGELAIFSESNDAIIIRTSWLYHSSGNNFLKKIIQLISDRRTLGVVSDQIGSPTAAIDLANFILQLPQLDIPTRPIVYNFANSGVASWYDLACAIQEELTSQGFTNNCSIQPITTDEYPTTTERPFYSVLSLSKIRNELKLTPRHWRQALRETIRHL